jgi:hypothetical protein
MIKKTSAIVAIMLILALPIYSASVFASINNVGVFGKDNINGYRRQDDLTYAKADVSIIGDDDIDAEQVFFNDNQFSNCKASGDYFTCVLGLNKNNLEPKTHSFTISLKDDSGKTAGSYAGTFVVDAQAPLITSFSITPKIIKKGNVTVEYNVRDYSYETQQGSGLEKIIICKDDLSNVIEEVEINGTSCLDSRKFNYKTSEFISSTGSADICIIAYDMLGQASELRCETLTVDENKPEIKKSSFEITDINGNEINYISTKPIPAIVSIQIEDESLLKVTADLSELGSGIEEAVCLENECAWPVTIKLSDSGKASIKITAEDGVGNTDEETVSYTFDFDNAGPVVESISNGMDEGIKYLGKKNNFVLEIEEEDSGLSLGNVWIKIGNNKIKADECVKNSKWKCYFNDVKLNSAHGSSVAVSVSSDSTDDVGNNFDLDNGVSSETFVMDAKPPSLVGDIELNTVENKSYPIEEFVSGDRLNIKAVLNEETELNAFADLSSLGLGNAEQGSCAKEDNNWVCEWNTGAIASGPIEGTLYFNFTDNVGNSAREAVEISVLGVDNEENPDYWYVGSIEKMPEAVDRQTTELISHKQYVHVKLNPIYAESGTSILATDLECNGDLGYIQDYELINENSEDPYIVLTLNQQEMPENSLSLKCNLLIISKICGDAIAANVEEEPVEFTVDFYNMPLGEIGDNVKNKIKEAQDSWLVQQEWIGELEKFITYAEKICNLLEIWNKANKALADVEALLEVIKIPGIADTVKTNFKQITDKSVDSYKKVVESKYNLCKYISCDEGLWGDWYNEMRGDYSKPLGDSGFNAEIWPSNPKESLVLSLATGCLPGIVHNLQKRRQVECYYVLCLKNAAAEGVSLYVCDEQKAYLECMFIYGEIFQIVPFASFFKGLAENIETIFADPLGMIFAGLNFYCDMQPAGKLHAGCVLAHLVPTLAEITEDIVGFADTESWQVGDVCEEALKPVDDLKTNAEKSLESENETDEEGQTEEDTNEEDTNQEGEGENE